MLDIHRQHCHGTSYRSSLPRSIGHYWSRGALADTSTPQSAALGLRTHRVSCCSVFHSVKERRPSCPEHSQGQEPAEGCLQWNSPFADRSLQPLKLLNQFACRFLQPNQISVRSNAHFPLTRPDGDREGTRVHVYVGYTGNC